MFKVPASLATMLLAGSACAQVTDFKVTSTTDGNRVANVLAIDFTGNYTGSQILLELTSGSIINETFFGGAVNTAPFSGQVAAAPDLRFDTYLAQGDLLANGPGAVGSPSLGGGAVGIRGTEAAAVFNNATKISQAYNPAPGTFFTGGTDFVVAQIGLTSDANGTFTYFASANSSFFVTGVQSVEYTIINGVIRPVPEPALGVALLSALSLIGRRRHP